MRMRTQSHAPAFQTLITACCVVQTRCRYDTPVDMEKMRKDAQALHSAGEGK
jgi:hypothetical protein